MIDPASPFADRETTVPVTRTRLVHVNFCSVCHYVWKAPAEARTCINCKGNGLTARSLVSYETEVQIT